MREKNRSKFQMMIAMFIFGTIGTIRKNIFLPSSLIIIFRGILGSALLLLLLKLKKMPLNKTKIKSNLPFLLLSGIALGFNWMLSFESYRFTTVAIGTVCLYMGPVFLILLSPFILKEKLSLKKLICILFAFVGMILISGIFTNELQGTYKIKGILFGLGAAIFYVPIVLLNKKTSAVPAYDKTIIQLLTATIILFPYTFLTVEWNKLSFTPTSILLLLILGIIHTGIGYTLYFNSMKNMEAHVVALFSYIDPAVSILLSIFFLRESIGFLGLLGAAMILGATLTNELTE